MANFDEAISYVLQNEGGYVNNPLDRGGATNFGVTEATARSFGYTGPMSQLPQETAQSIIRAGFWDSWSLDDIENQTVATAVLDLHMNGSVSAAKIIQRALASLGWEGSQDGLWGPATRAGVNQADPGSFMQAIGDESANWYRSVVAYNPTQSVFLNGWLNRAARLGDMAAQAAEDAVDAATEAVTENPGSSMMALGVIVGLGWLALSGRGRG